MIEDQDKRLDALKSEVGILKVRADRYGQGETRFWGVQDEGPRGEKAQDETVMVQVPERYLPTREQLASNQPRFEQTRPEQSKAQEPQYNQRKRGNDVDSDTEMADDHVASHKRSKHPRQS